MTAPTLDKSYWESRWTEGQTGWDIGSPSAPLVEYFDQLEDRKMKILIPGCGNAWEGEYLHQLGFENVYLMDLAPSALEHFIKRVPDFPEEHMILGDFFQLNEKFDLIIEQTFFCAISPKMRRQYAEKAHSLLNENGKLVGLLFETDFDKDTPPYGGHKQEYLGYFQPWFNIKYCDIAYNSIKPRFGRELFVNFIRK
ncbi:MAG: SAM-dependent methyltransferase [Flavobacteriales bacterium]